MCVKEPRYCIGIADTGSSCISMILYLFKSRSRCTTHLMTIPAKVCFWEASPAAPPALKLKWGTPETAPAAHSPAVDIAWTHIARRSPSG